MDAEILNALVTICIGIGLAASCGFRVFVPLLMISVASRAEYLSLSDGFEWLSTWPAVAALGMATALEIGAYYFPWLDNFLDTVSTPAAVIAGVIASASCIQDVDPMLKWSVAIIAGGGFAGTIKTGAAGLRAASTLTTGGTANPLVATAEWIFSVVLSFLAMIVPIAAAIVAVVLVFFLARFAWRVISKLGQARAGQPEPGDGG